MFVALLHHHPPSGTYYIHDVNFTGSAWFYRPVFIYYTCVYASVFTGLMFPLAKVYLSFMVYVNLYVNILLSECPKIVKYFK